MDLWNLLGLVSIVVLNAGWWAQVAKVVKTKSTRDLSTLFLVMAIVCFTGLQVYTLHIVNWVYLIGNSIGMGGVVALIFLKYRFEGSERADEGQKRL